MRVFIYVYNLCIIEMILSGTWLDLGLQVASRHDDFRTTRNVFGGIELALGLIPWRQQPSWYNEPDFRLRADDWAHEFSVAN
jgi:hypothetical protein